MSDEASDEELRAEAAALYVCNPRAPLATAYLDGARAGRASMQRELEEAQRLALAMTESSNAKDELWRVCTDELIAIRRALAARGDDLRKETDGECINDMQRELEEARARIAEAESVCRERAQRIAELGAALAKERELREWFAAKNETTALAIGVLDVPGGGFNPDAMPAQALRLKARIAELEAGQFVAAEEAVRGLCIENDPAVCGLCRAANWLKSRQPQQPAEPCRASQTAVMRRERREGGCVAAALAGNPNGTRCSCAKCREGDG
jgi:hypothetical protein